MDYRWACLIHSEFLLYAGLQIIEWLHVSLNQDQVEAFVSQVLSEGASRPVADSIDQSIGFRCFGLRSWLVTRPELEIGDGALWVKILLSVEERPYVS